MLASDLAFYLSVRSASFQIKLQLLCSLFYLPNVLHYYDVKWLERVSWDSKYPVNPRNNRLILSAFEMLNKFVDIFQEDIFFIFINWFDDKTSVVCVKEETSTWSRTLASLKSLFFVASKINWWHNIFWCDPVHLHYFFELQYFVAC